MLVRSMKRPVPQDTGTRVSSPYFIRSIARGLAVLSAFSERDRALSLAEISSKVGLNKATTYRVLVTLEVLGYVYLDRHTKKYRPTLRILELGFAATDSIALLRGVALPHMKAMSQKHNESVSLATLIGDEILYLERIETTQLLNVTLTVGSRLPAYCTSMGKLLLAYQPKDRLEELLQSIDFLPRGPNTLLSREALRRQLETIRQKGYSINDQELAVGVRSVAAPIRSRSGEVIAALNMAVPSARVPLEELASQLASDVIASARAISAEWAKVTASGNGLGLG